MALRIIHFVMVPALLAPGLALGTAGTNQLDESTCHPYSATREGCWLGLPCPTGEFMKADSASCTFTNCQSSTPVYQDDGAGRFLSANCSSDPTPGDSYVTLQAVCCLPLASTPATQTKNESGATVTGEKKEEPHSSPPAPAEPQVLSMNLLDQASRQSLSLGFIDCLEGLQKTSANSPSGEAQVSSCLKETDAARQLQEKAREAAKQAGRDLAAYEPEASIMESDRARNAISGYEEKIGNSHDLLQHLASGDALAGVEGGLPKSWAEKKKQAFLEAVNAKKEEGALSRSDAPEKLTPSALRRDRLRDEIRRRLAKRESDGPQVAARASGKKSIDSEDQLLQSLTPIDDPLFTRPGASDEAGLTLFEIVRRRYKDKWEMLIPYRQRKQGEKH